MVWGTPKEPTQGSMGTPIGPNRPDPTKPWVLEAPLVLGLRTLKKDTDMYEEPPTKLKLAGVRGAVAWRGSRIPEELGSERLYE